MQGQEVDSEAVAVLGPFPQDPRPQNSRFIHGVLIKPFFLHLILGVSPGTRWALSEALSTRTERETEAWGHCPSSLARACTARGRAHGHFQSGREVRSRTRPSSVGLVVQLSGLCQGAGVGADVGAGVQGPPVAGLKPPLGGACLVSWWSRVSQQLAHTAWRGGWPSMGSLPSGGAPLCAQEEGRASGSRARTVLQPCSLHWEPGPPSCRPRREGGPRGQRVGEALHKACAPAQMFIENGKSD